MDLDHNQNVFSHNKEIQNLGKIILTMCTQVPECLGKYTSTLTAPSYSTGAARNCVPTRYCSVRLHTAGSKP